MRKVILSMAIAIMILTVGCGQSTNKKQVESKEVSKSMDSHNHGDHEHGNSTLTEKRDIETSTQKNDATTAIVDSYLQIKNALVSDDQKAAAKGGTALLAAFSKFDMTKLTENQHKEYMEIFENSKENAEHIVKSPIDHQREHFEVLSIDINDLIALLGTNKKLYETFCPMANNGKGAIWLSEFKDIKNPFFGSKMINCGKVQKEIN
tara:strand:- start:1146 stop:1766 length:621 start_codon:yes stop_codon:yes gene_type:complete